MMTSDKRNVPLALFFSASALFLFFFLTNKIPLWSSDEGRYGEIAREMAESGDWVVPAFNYVDYLEKPALSPWVTALSYLVFGVSHLTTRLPSILFALAGILMTYRCIKKLFDRQTAGLAAMVLLTSIGYVLVGRFAVIDMASLYFLSAALFSLMTGYFTKQRRYYFLAYVFMGFGFLTKGLIAMVLPGLTMLIFLWWVRDLGEITKLHIGWGLLMIAVIIFPWLAAMSLREPEFLNLFIVKHHFDRFVSGSLGRKRPFWFYTYILPLLSFPWTLFIPSAIVNGLRQKSEHRDKIKFLVCWFGVIFFFFSASHSKLPYYIVPVCVPVAVLAAHFLSACISGARTGENMPGAGWIWKIFLGLCLTAVPVLTAVAFLVPAPEIQMLRPVIPAGAVWIGVSGAVSFWLYRMKRPAGAVFSMAGMTYGALLVVFWGMLRMSPLQSTEAFAAELHPVLTQEDRVAVYGSPDRVSDFPFHLRRRIMIVGSDRGTLRVESLEDSRENQSADWFLSADDFAKRFKETERRVYCLLEEENISHFTQRQVTDYRVIKRGGGKLLIANR